MAEDAPPVKSSTSMRTQAPGGNAKEEEVVPERLTLDDPRMLASMKVHGVSAEELMASSPPPPRKPNASSASPRKAPPVSEEGQKRRQELWERKRADLLATVEETASALDIDGAEQILAPDLIANAKEAGRTAVLRPEVGEAKLEALRKSAKLEAAKIVDDQRNRLLALQKSTERQELVQKQLAEKRQEEYAALLEKIEARQKKRGEEGRRAEKEDERASRGIQRADEKDQELLQEGGRKEGADN